MTIARLATFSLFTLFAAFAPSIVSPSIVSAAPASSSALTFNVTARVGAMGDYSGPQQTIQARVLLQGKTARVETVTAGTPAVVLLSPPYVYRLLPNAKAGVRWTMDTRKPTAFSQLDPQELLRDPSKLKAALIQSGAKKVGVATLNGVPTDIYQTNKLDGKVQRAKVWLRRQDSLPARLETVGGQIKIIASWSNYARPASLPASLFAPPKNFHVRQVAGHPPFSMM